MPHSTPEAELVAADAGVRAEGLPAVTLWEILLGRTLDLVLCEDNQLAARVIETGRNRTMRHIGRTHKADLAFLHERFARGDIKIEITPALRQSADIFTKAFNAARLRSYLHRTVEYVLSNIGWHHGSLWPVADNVGCR